MFSKTISVSGRATPLQRCTSCDSPANVVKTSTFMVIDWASSSGSRSYKLRGSDSRVIVAVVEQQDPRPEARRRDSRSCRGPSRPGSRRAPVQGCHWKFGFEMAGRCHKFPMESIDLLFHTEGGVA